MTRRLSEQRDDDGRLIAKLCPICFSMTPVADLWQDAEGQTWDLCSEACAVAAGLDP